MNRVLKQHTRGPPQLQQYQPRLARSDAAEQSETAMDRFKRENPEMLGQKLSFAPTVQL